MIIYWSAIINIKGLVGENSLHNSKRLRDILLLNILFTNYHLYKWLYNKSIYYLLSQVKWNNDLILLFIYLIWDLSVLQNLILYFT